MSVMSLLITQNCAELELAWQSVAFEKYEYYLYNPELTPLQPTTIENRDFKALFTLGIKY